MAKEGIVRRGIIAKILALKGRPPIVIIAAVEMEIQIEQWKTVEITILVRPLKRVGLDS